MLDLRARLLFLIGIPIVIITGLVVFLILKPDSKLVDNGSTQIDATKNGNNDGQNSGDGLSDPGYQTSPAGMPAYVPSTQEERDDIYVKQVSRNFVERFYSYSNQNGNSHIADAVPMATDSMADYVKKQEIPRGEIYEGVTTKVIASDVLNRSTTEATVNVGVQQQLMKGAEITVIYKNGKVDLKFIDGDWKVNAVYWQ